MPSMPSAVQLPATPPATSRKPPSQHAAQPATQPATQHATQPATLLPGRPPAASTQALTALGDAGARYLAGLLRQDSGDPLYLAVAQAWRYWLGWTELLFGVADDEAADKRFTHQAWREDPRYLALQRGYRSYSRFMLHSLEHAPLSELVKRQLGFAMRQAIDAMSPANFLATNPEALQLALETQGASLAKGIELFLRDAARGRITLSDEGAFAVGKNLATTPGAVVYENELMQLIHYRPQCARVARRPLVLVPPCINKFYILDLQEHNSMVRYLLSQGQNVFLVSWRNITPAQGHFRWDDYLQLGIMQALQVARDIGAADQVNAMGFCIGGALLTSALAVLAARGQEPVASLTLLATMLDYADTGEIGLMVSERTVQARERSIGRGGVMAGAELSLTFSALRANDLIWPYVVKGYLQGHAPQAFDLLFWNADTTNLPGPMFAWYLRHTYLQNRLRVAGGTLQCGEPVDLARVKLPTYLYASKEDHLVPWQTAYESVRILGGPATFVLGASGHVAGVINAPSQGKRHYHLGGQLESSAAQWLAGAREQQGSWWPHWAAWLQQHSGGQVAAPRQLGNNLYREIEPAPGRYVRESP